MKRTPDNLSISSVFFRHKAQAGFGLVETLVTIGILVWFLVSFSTFAGTIVAASNRLLKQAIVDAKADELLALVTYGNWFPSEKNTINNLVSNDNDITINLVNTSASNLQINFFPTLLPTQDPSPTLADYNPDTNVISKDKCTSQFCRMVYFEKVTIGTNSFTVAVVEVRWNAGNGMYIQAVRSAILD